MHRLVPALLTAFALLLPAAAEPPHGMVLVPGGSFTMGDDNGGLDERPAHQVTLSPFFIDRHEVTIAQFARYAREKGAYESLEIFRDAGLDSQRPYWRYLRAFVYQDGGSEASTPNDMLWDAMAGLVYGYTGHTWFIYTIDINNEIDPVLFDAENDFNANPTNLWHVVNAILQPPETTNWAPGAGSDPYLSAIECTTSTFLEILIGFFQDDAGEYYFMVQNVSHDSGAWPNNVTGTETIRLSFDFTQAPQSTNRTALQTLNKLNGLVESIPLTQHDGTTGYLDVTLEAGDAILLKYDTGAPFALQP